MEKGCESGTSPAAYPTWTIRPKIRNFRQNDFALLFYFSLADDAV
jgi:hypothetical protein